MKRENTKRRKMDKGGNSTPKASRMAHRALWRTTHGQTVQGRRTSKCSHADDGRLAVDDRREKRGRERGKSDGRACGETGADRSDASASHLSLILRCRFCQSVVVRHHSIPRKHMPLALSQVGCQSQPPARRGKSLPRR